MSYIPIPLEIPPGIFRENTDEASSGRYTDGNMVRFWKGKPERWRGWNKLITPKMDGPARGALSWQALDGTKLLAWGTPNKLWLLQNAVLYDITPVGLPAGFADAADTLGWGAGGWGANTWGGAGDALYPNGILPTTWTLAKWGEDLLACRRGGLIYRWRKSLGPSVKAADISPNAPRRTLAIFVTEGNRHLIAMGTEGLDLAFDALLVRWPNQETLDQWTPSEVNTAGDLRAEDGSQVIGSITCRGGNLILTDRACYFHGYIGGGFIFEMPRVSRDCGMVSPHAGVEKEGIAYWMGLDCLYSYNGAVSRIDCGVERFVFDSINKGQQFKVFAASISAFDELIWFYPDGSGAENNRFVAFNNEGWSIGALARTSWLDDSVASAVPIATAPDGTIYQQEVGTLGDGQAIPYFLEVGNVHMDSPQIAAGVSAMQVRKVVPDYKRLDGAHRLTIAARQHPQGPESVKGPYPFSISTKSFGARARGRSFRLRFEGEGDFRMGVCQAHVTPHGGR